MTKKISAAHVGETFTLRFFASNGSEYGTHTLKYLEGEGEDQYAWFEASAEEGGYLWAAYRYNGHWAYGSSADKLTVAANQ